MLAHQPASRVGCSNQPFCPPLSADQVRRLCRSAEFFAGRLVRRLELSREDWGDFRQEIALQVLTRLRHFDESRAPFGAFVDLVARRAANRLKARAARRRAWELLVDPQSSDPTDPTGDDADEGADRTTVFRAEDRHLAFADLRHDLRAALEGAPGRIADTFTVFDAGHDAHQPVSRTTWFRRRVELLRWLLAHGLAPPQ
jgi:hypothetical protein